MDGKLFFVLLLAALPNRNDTSCGSMSGGPHDNPIATLYGNGTYAWADTMVNWSCVYNVKDYGGSFEETQKAAMSLGGGVVYFPAGIYSFKANIMIESNVVIRGEPTTEMAKKGPGPVLDHCHLRLSLSARLESTSGYSTLILKVQTLESSTWS